MNSIVDQHQDGNAIPIGLDTPPLRLPTDQIRASKVYHFVRERRTPARPGYVALQGVAIPLVSHAFENQRSDLPSPTQLSKSRMGKIEGETCSVCREKASKYRCPGCSAPYCSLACNKVHKAGGGVGSPRPPCTGKRVVPGSKQAGGQSSRKRPRFGGDDADATEPATRACVRKGRDQWRGGREDREEEEWQMSADQRDRISGCSWLKVALRDPKLQGLLAEIDQADEPEKVLAFHRTNRQFGDFMDKLLLEIEEYRKGGADEPALVAADL